MIPEPEEKKAVPKEAKPKNKKSVASWGNWWEEKNKNNEAFLKAAK